MNKETIVALLCLLATVLSNLFVAVQPTKGWMAQPLAMIYVLIPVAVFQVIVAVAIRNVSAYRRLLVAADVLLSILSIGVAIQFGGVVPQ